MDENESIDLSSNEFKAVYDSIYDDPLHDFYIPSLSNSIQYDRMTGFFTSQALSVASEGIANLIKNNGNMRMITCPRLDPRDVEAIEQGLENKEKMLESKLLGQIIEEYQIKNNSIEALGWMISNNKLEIKIALVLDKNGNIMDKDSVDRSGIFHKKTGIFKDNNNNIVVFSGSVNETGSGWIRNVEQIDTYCSWKPGTDEYIRYNMYLFEKYWNDEVPNVKIIEFPEAVAKEWISKVPSDKGELAIMKSLNKSIKPKPRKPREYQKEAISNWLKNDGRGILNMATGTGKTFTAVHAICELKNNLSIDKKIIIVAVPFQHLMKNPWEITILDIIKEEPDLIIASGNNPKWPEKLREQLHNFRFGAIDDLYILTTYDTLSSERFKELMRPHGKNILLIGDEAHNAGATQYSSGLLEEYKFRLGLSATPERYFDEEGTLTINDYFGGEVYSFSLKKAINEINPESGETFLTPYYYHPVFVSLSEDEETDYRKKSSQIAQLYSKSERTKEEEYKLSMIRLSRAKIVKNAKSKIDALDELLDTLSKEKEIKNCLIYCADGKDEGGTKTLEKVVGILNKRGINSRRFTSMEDDKVRQEILSDFAKGTPGVLAAIKCLDEGVDVPSTQTAIIMASTGNSREYIQRRGRVLRRSPGKTSADIFDFIIFPHKLNLDPTSDLSEINLIKKELSRFEEFSSLSLNDSDNIILFENELKKYGITLGDLENV